MFNIIAFFIDNAVCPVISEDCHFTHMWKALAWQHHFTTREVWTHKTSLSSPLFIGVAVPRKGSEWSCICVLKVYFASFYNVSIGIWKCSDSVVFFGGNVSDSVVFFGGNVQTVWYFLGKCSDSVCGIFCFSFYYLHRTR